MIDIKPDKTDRDRNLDEIYGDPEAELKEIKREFLRLQFEEQLAKRIKH